MNQWMFSKRRRLLGGAILSMAGALPAPSGARGKQSLRVVTSHLPPLSIEHGGARPGALHEVMSELCRRTGLAPAVTFVPWQRALFMAQKMPRTIIFPVTRLPERERKFRWLVPLFEENYVFLAPRGSAFDVHRPLNMQDMRIALIRGALKSVLLELGFKNIVEGRSVDEVHRFVVGGMADAAFGELAIVRNSLRTRRAVDEFDVSEPVRRTAAWLAGSLDFGASEVARFERAFRDMKADGSYDTILRRYQLR